MSGPQNPRVTQADRDAGAEFWAFLGQHGSAEECRSGTGFRATAEAFARHREAAEAASKAREAALVEAINNALCCTPTLRWRGHDDAEIVYDCGNPWEILRAALTKEPDA